MKYTVKVNIDKLENYNAGLTDASGSALPPQFGSRNAYTIVTDLKTSGSLKLTATEVKAQIRDKFSLQSAVSESLQILGVEVTTGNIEYTTLAYTATLPPVIGGVDGPPTASIQVTPVDVPVKKKTHISTPPSGSASPSGSKPTSGSI